MLGNGGKFSCIPQPSPAMFCCDVIKSNIDCSKQRHSVKTLRSMIIGFPIFTPFSTLLTLLYLLYSHHYCTHYIIHMLYCPCVSLVHLLWLCGLWHFIHICFLWPNWSQPHSWTQECEGFHLQKLYYKNSISVIFKEYSMPDRFW